MRDLLSRCWWMLVLRGVAAMAFGVLALVWPGPTLVALIALFAAYAIVSGAVAIVAALRNRQQSGWWLPLLLGVIGVIAGGITIVYPALTALALMFVIGINALFVGVLDIAMAIRLRKEIEGEWLLGLAGAVSVVFGLFVLLYPGAGAIALLWIIGVYAIAVGLTLVVLGARLRGAGRPPADRTAGASA